MPKPQPDRRMPSRPRKASKAARTETKSTGKDKSPAKRKSKGKGVDLRKLFSKQRAGSAPPLKIISAVEMLVNYMTDGDTIVRGKKWQPVFLQALRTMPNVSVACRIAGISRNEAYRKREESAEFFSAWEDAFEEGVDQVEAAALRRAVYGCEKPIYYKGFLVGSELEYSDTLAALLLKGRRRDVFGEKVEMEHSGRMSMTLAEFEARVKDGEA